MLRTTSSQSFNGTSVIEETTGGQIIVASMYATINEDGNVNINKSITNRDMYTKHKTEIQKDFDDFENLVYSHIEEVTDNE